MPLKSCDLTVGISCAAPSNLSSYRMQDMKQQPLRSLSSSGNQNCMIACGGYQKIIIILCLSWKNTALTVTVTLVIYWKLSRNKDKYWHLLEIFLHCICNHCSKIKHILHSFIFHNTWWWYFKIFKHYRLLKKPMLVGGKWKSQTASRLKGFDLW